VTILAKLSADSIKSLDGGKAQCKLFLFLSSDQCLYSLLFNIGNICLPHINSWIHANSIASSSSYIYEMFVKSDK
jgi:hypothetical protein